MGFLTGAYLKMSSAKTRLNLQNQLTRITMRMQRITRDMGRMERQLNMMQRNCKMTLQGQLQQALAGGQSQFQIYMDPSNPNIFNNPNATEAEKQNMDQALRSYSIFQQAEMYRTSQAQAMWDDYFEQYREAMLEPLKDEEQALQIQTQTHRRSRKSRRRNGKIITKRLRSAIHRRRLENITKIPQSSGIFID